MPDSRQKGQRGELLFRDFLRTEFADTVDRGQQKKGGGDSPDVESALLRRLGIHPEVKWYAECAFPKMPLIRSWMDQAKRDAHAGQTPVVFHKWNRSEWWAIVESPKGYLFYMRAVDFLKMYQQDFHAYGLAKIQGELNESIRSSV